MDRAAELGHPRREKLYVAVSSDQATVTDDSHQLS
jgi:hypothetical protein